LIAGGCLFQSEVFESEANVCEVTRTAPAAARTKVIRFIYLSASDVVGHGARITLLVPEQYVRHRGDPPGRGCVTACRW
jgi:hypothetical protein